MRLLFRSSALLLLFIAGAAQSQSVPASELSMPVINLIDALTLPGSFVSRQMIYADSERIFLCSFQGDLFVLRRDAKSHFPLLQTIHIGSSLTAVRGDRTNVYVTSRNGFLYVFPKTWPLPQPAQSLQLSSYGLTSLEVLGGGVYVAKGQAAMAASNSALYISELNAGDTGLDVVNMRTYGEAFSPNSTLVYDRLTLQSLGEILNPGHGQVSITATADFVYLTTPGCCGTGIDVYNAATLQHTQFLGRTANVVAPIKQRGVGLLLAGTEAGTIDLYALRDGLYTFLQSFDLRVLTGFIGPEDIEIRTLWMDGLDNLVFAGSSWGNDRSRSNDLPSLFILEIQPRFQETSWRVPQARPIN